MSPGVVDASGRRVDHQRERRDHADLHVAYMDDLLLRLILHAGDEELVFGRFVVLAWDTGVLGLRGVLAARHVAALSEWDEHALAGVGVPIDAPEAVARGERPEQRLSELVREVEAIPMVGQQGLEGFRRQHVVVVLGAGHGREDRATLDEHGLLPHDERKDLIVGDPDAPRQDRTPAKTT
jgi:hypothetical protein